PFFPGGPPVVVDLGQTGPDSQCQSQPQVGDTIPTELIAMDLVGNAPGIGQVHVRESPTRQSLGHITVTGPGAPISGDSFFDVFVDITADGLPLYNDQPFHIQSHIAELPPHNRKFETPQASDVLLYD